MIVFLIGYMGSGKSTLGKKLASRLNFEFLDLDDVVEAEADMPISEMFEIFGEDRFRELEETCLKDLAGRSHLLVATGGGAPVHGKNMEWMNANGLTVYLKMSPGMLASRLRPNKTKRPLIAHLADAELEGFIAKHLASREGSYEKAQVIYDANSMNAQRLDELKNIIQKQA